MADMKIEAADTVSNPNGGELIPVAAGQDGARTPGKVSINTIKSLTLAAIKDIAGLGEGESVISGDSVLMKRHTETVGEYEERHVTIDDVATLVAELLFNKESGTSPYTGYKVIVGDASENPKTMDLTVLANYVSLWISQNETTSFFNPKINGLTSSADIADADALPTYQTREGQTAGNKKVTVAQLLSKAFGDIPSKAVDITTETPAATFDATDCILIDKGGVVKKVQLQNSGLTKGGAKAPVSAETGAISTVTGNIPQWADNSGNLSNGLDVVSSVGPAEGTGAASNDNIPTEAAVRTAVDACVKKNGSTTANKIPQWNDANGTLKDGMAIATSSDHGTVSDGHIPTFTLLKDEIAARSSEQQSPRYISGIAEIASPKSGYEGELRMCKVKVGETYVGDALFIWRGGVWRWDFVSWLKSSMPTESETLSTLFYGKGSALPTTGSTVKKSQLFILSGNATAGADGLYVAMADAPDPGWAKLGS